MDKLKEFIKKYPGLCVILGIAVLFTIGFSIYMNNYNSKKEISQDIYESISNNILTTPEVSENQVPDVAEDEPEVVITPEPLSPELEAFLAGCGDARDLYEPLLVEVNMDFDELHGINGDIIAYLIVPDSLINYPILYKEDEPDYYLNKNIDGSTGFPGCIYIQNYNNPDFNDALTILYGHNMLNDTMFGMLPEYNKPEWRCERPYFIVYTESGIFVYEVEVCSTYSDEHLLVDDFHKDEESGEWIFDGLSSQDAISARKHIKSRGSGSAYFADTQWTEEDKVVAMSTCGNKGERYIVAGRQVFVWDYNRR